MSKIKADQVWNQLGYTGTGVVIGFVDIGMNGNHFALSGKYHGNITYSFVQLISGYGTCTVTSPYDDHRDGTHVTGIILGSDGGSNQIGVAPGAKWLAAKTLDYTGSSWSNDLLAAMQWMLAPGDNASMAPDVVNSSWGSNFNYSNYYQTVIQTWRSAGIVPIFANGNAGPGSSTIGTPACLPEAIGIGSTNSSDFIASSSSRGPSSYGDIKPDVSAPGVSIRSASYSNNYGYVYMSGTSMASPHVSGSCVDAAGKSIPDSGQIESYLKSTAIDLGTAGADNTYGWGRVDALAAVQAVADPPGIPTLISPINSNALPDATFVWSALLSVTQYYLRNDGSGEGTAYQAASVCSGSTSSVTLSSPLSFGVHIWELRGWNSYGHGTWSSPINFIVLAPVSSGTYDDTNTNITYIGSWSTYNGSGPYNNTILYSTAAGDTAALLFIGTQVKLVYLRAASRGVM